MTDNPNGSPPSERIMGEPENPRKNQLVAGIGEIDGIRVLQFTMPLDKWLTQGDEGTASMIGNFELAKQWALMMMGQIRQKEAEKKPQIVKPSMVQGIKNTVLKVLK